MKKRAMGDFIIVFSLLGIFDLIRNGEVLFPVNIVAAAVFAFAYYLLWTKMRWYKAPGKIKEPETGYPFQVLLHLAISRFS